MDPEFLEALKNTPAFVNLLETSRTLIESVMSTPLEVINTQHVVGEPAHRMDREAKVATPKVAEVLAEVPKSSRTSRPKPTPTKET